MKCTYRPTFDCRLPKERYSSEGSICALCLSGQQIDIFHLMYDAFMEKKSDKLEDDMHEPN